MSFLKKKKFALVCSVCALFLGGCGSEDKPTEIIDEGPLVEEAISTAYTLMEQNQVEQAIEQLESFRQEYSENTDIIEALAFAYARVPNYEMELVYFQWLLRKDPSRSDIALYMANASSQLEDWQAAATSYERYLKDNPKDSGTLKKFAETLIKLEQPKAALDAYQRALTSRKRRADVNESLAVGTLFLQVGDNKQAEQWLEYVLKLKPTDSATLAKTQLGLLQIAHSKKDWEKIEKHIKNFPETALNADSKKVFQKIQQTWTSHQKEQAAQKKAEEEKARLEAEAIAAAEALKAEEAASETDTAPLEESEDAPIETVVTQNEEALESTSEPVNDKGLPSSFETEEPTTTASSEETIEELPTLETLPAIVPYVEPEPEPIQFELALDAKAKGDYDEAIRLLTLELSENSEFAEAWFELSRTYYLKGDWSQAELYASEAMRRNREQVSYRINFIKAIQKTQTTEVFFRELIQARSDFPESPEITLALAQAYHKIARNYRNARFLYERFLDLAPYHAKADDVRNAMNSLPVPR